MIAQQSILSIQFRVIKGLDPTSVINTGIQAISQIFKLLITKFQFTKYL